MFKALNLEMQEEVVLLSRRWLAQIPYLRSLDRQDRLACPVCRKPVRVRAGKLRRPHFAHKHLENCPYRTESAVLLETRAVLYEWLVGQYGEDAVDLEVRHAIPSMRRPVDCQVSGGEREIAYWIIERRMPPDERERLGQYFESSRMAVQWVFTASMINQGDNPSTLFLTTTEREFMRRSDYDAIYTGGKPSPVASLHYLDVDNRVWITYRALRVVHPPQAYHGQRESHPLRMVNARPADGEPVHPGEDARLEGLRQAWQAEEKKKQAASERIKDWSGKFKLQEVEPGLERELFSQEATCVFCGERTSDWWYINKAEGTCKCYACRDKGRM
jgi:hypothetical protein